MLLQLTKTDSKFFGSEPLWSVHSLRKAPDSYFGENFDVSGVRNHFSGAKVIKTYRKRFPWVCSSMFEYVQVCSEYVRVCSTTLHDARWSDSDPGILNKYLWNHCIVNFFYFSWFAISFSTFHSLRRCCRRRCSLCVSKTRHKFRLITVRKFDVCSPKTIIERSRSVGNIVNN